MMDQMVASYYRAATEGYMPIVIPVELANGTARGIVFDAYPTSSPDVHQFTHHKDPVARARAALIMIQMKRESIAARFADLILR